MQVFGLGNRGRRGQEVLSVEDELLEYEEAYKLTLSPHRKMVVLLPKDIDEEVAPHVHNSHGTRIFSLLDRRGRARAAHSTRRCAN